MVPQNAQCCLVYANRARQFVIDLLRQPGHAQRGCTRGLIEQSPGIFDHTLNAMVPVGRVAVGIAQRRVMVQPVGNCGYARLVDSVRGHLQRQRQTSNARADALHCVGLGASHEAGHQSAHVRGEQLRCRR